VEIIPRCLVMEVFATSKHQRIMMMFAMVMMEVTAMCAMEMMMNATAMCRTEIMGRLPTMIVLVMTSRVLSRTKQKRPWRARGGALTRRGEIQ
jgi:hypothetical protein